MRAKETRAKARESLSGNWGKAILASLIASIFGVGGGFSTSFNIGESETITDMASLEAFIEANAQMILGVGIASMLVGVVMFIIASAVGVGYAEFNNDLVCGRELRIASLFSKFKQTKTAVCANLLVFVRVFLATLLLIIPGIIAAYKYAMVSHVMADHPELSAREALAHSKEIMRGNKWRLFCLGFSFIGWNLLVAITLGIAAIWVVPYEQAAIAAFYNEIK